MQRLCLLERRGKIGRDNVNEIGLGGTTEVALIMPSMLIRYAYGISEPLRKLYRVLGRHNWPWWKSKTLVIRRPRDEEYCRRT